MKTSASVLTLCIAALAGGWALAQEDEERSKLLDTIEKQEMQVRAVARSLPKDLAELMAIAAQSPEIRHARAAAEMAQADLHKALAELAPSLRPVLQHWKQYRRTIEDRAERHQSSRETADNELLLEYSRFLQEAMDSLREDLSNMSVGRHRDRPARVYAYSGVRGFDALAQMRIPQPRPAYEEGTPEDLRGSLASPVSFVFNDISVMDIFDFFFEQYELSITVDLVFPPPQIRHVELRNVPMRSALLALTDQMGDACFVIRDYGLFLTTRERAQTLAGPTIPEDVPYLAPLPPGQFQGGFGGGWFSGGGGGGFGGGGGSLTGPGDAPGKAPAAPQEPIN